MNIWEFLTQDNVLSDFLNTTLISNHVVYVDFWLFVHFFTGMALYWGLSKYFKIKGYKALFIISILVIAYEIFEYRFIEYLFKLESVINILSDLLAGMLGGFLLFKLKNDKQ